MRAHILFLILLPWAAGISAQENNGYSAPGQKNDGWMVTDLETLGFDFNRVDQVLKKLHTDPHKIDAILAVHNGKLILEEYFNSYTIDSRHDLRSVTKSITSLLIGIALEQGYINSIDDPISKYLEAKRKKNPDPRKEKISIRHLLTMSPGWECDDWNPKSAGQEDRVYRKKDWVQYTLDLPMERDPGSSASYCSMGVIILKTILEKSSNMTIDAFAQKFLFDPLGITNPKWDHTSDKKVITAGKRLYLSPRQLAKIGQLVLNNGIWEGAQIVPDKWIREATSRHTKITDVAYGYLWWRLPFRQGNTVYEALLATGNGGQYIMIFKELDLVFLFTGSAYNSDADKIPFAFVNDILLRTFLDGPGTD